jgi:flagellar motor switch protein FliN/FliY
MKRGSIGDVKVPLQVVLGETALSVEEIARMGEGTIIELDNLAGEPVDLMASGTPIAKGEVVVIDESFGIRITRLMEQEE